MNQKKYVKGEGAQAGRGTGARPLLLPDGEQRLARKERVKMDHRGN